MDLFELRQQLSLLDTQLLELIAQRQQIVAEIGRVKLEDGRSTRDFKREKEVLDLALRTATDIGMGSMSGVGIVTGSSVTFAPQPAMSTVDSTPPMRLRKFALNSKYPAVVHAHEHLFRVAARPRVPSIATRTTLSLL